MTITVVQSQNTNAAWTDNFGGNVTAGNSIILIAFSYNGTAMSSSSPTFNGSSVTGASQLYGLQSKDNGVYCTAWMLPNVTGGATGYSLTSVNGTVNGNVGIAALEISGLNASPSLDSGAAPNPNTGFSPTGTGTVDSGATGNITSAPEIIIASAIGFGQNPGTPSPWSTLQPSSNCTAAWQIVTSSGSPYEFTGNAMSVNWCAGIAAVMPSSSGSTVTGGVSPLALAVPGGTVRVDATATGAISPLALAVPGGTVQSDTQVITGGVSSLILAAVPGGIVRVSGTGGNEYLALGIL